MASPMARQSPFPQPTSRGSGFSRRIASRVLLLIEKFESLTKTHSSHQALPLSQPSYTAARTSTLRRLGTSVLKRASLFAEQRVCPQSEKARPPKKRFLKVSKNRKKHQTAEKKGHKSQRVKSHNSSNGFDCDGPSSTINSNSTLIDTATSSTSTPPVARTLPSSFFDQLLPSNEHTPNRSKSKSRRAWGRKKKVVLSRESIQDLQGNLSQNDSTFASIKTKVVPPSLSVRDLMRRFQEAEKANMLGSLSGKEFEGSLRVLVQEPRSKDDKTSSGSSRGRSALRKANSTFGVLKDDTKGVARVVHNDEWFYGDSFYDTSMERDDIESTSTSGSTSAAVVCRDRSYLNTDLKYMPDGTLSNFGYFMHRLESEASTPSPESGVGTSNTSTYLTGTAQAGSPTPRALKVYRKTPPPSGFFNPENKRTSNKSGMQKVLGEDLTTKRYSEDLEIISPVPLNAVQAAELRGMVFRYT